MEREVKIRKAKPEYAPLWGDLVLERNTQVNGSYLSVSLSKEEAIKVFECLKEELIKEGYDVYAKL